MNMVITAISVVAIGVVSGTAIYALKTNRDTARDGITSTANVSMEALKKHQETDFK
jgi:hypothetical protein